ncbi:signal transducer and activator of transcription C, partial [Musca vetustissima]|uniref:signal transducer and activator of transcription C n=1 Tax=Musca vetustissima TaxID=27455 RepID=UPI002AB6C4CC
MWNFQRIICIWICCVSCMFGSTQLSSLVRAVPYEYFDDHDQSFYDLDTEQIQAKYDTRLLSQQMLKTSDAQNEQQQQQHQSLENQKGSMHLTEPDGYSTNEERKMIEEEHMGGAGGGAGASFVFNDNGKNGERGSVTDSDILTKLKTNDASQNGKNNNNNNNNDADTKDTTRIDETTPAITEKPEIHLPRAASCYTNGQKYTHGQKVPRLDSCEVCLCMDGEIFCWWEKCDKKVQKSQTPRYDDYSTPYGESSTMRIQANEKSTIRTTLRPMKKPKINKSYKFGQNGDDGEAADEDAAGLDGDTEDNEYDDSTYRYGKSSYKSHHNKQQQQQQQMTKKKKNSHEEQQQGKKALELKEKQMKKDKLKKQQQQAQQQQHKTNNDHHYHHPEHHTSGAGSSKILNFPENLPSVLYYDYKTEEHQHHQHQHREQHLKHQHEKELKHRQHAVNSRHHEYGNNDGGGVGGGGSGGVGVGQDFNMDMSVTLPAVAGTSQLGDSSAYGRNNVRGSDNDAVLQRQQQQPPSSAKFLANGNDNIYNNVDLQTDSDILPEPPTKKPKLSSIDTAEMAMLGAEG